MKFIINIISFKIVYINKILNQKNMFVRNCVLIFYFEIIIIILLRQLIFNKWNCDYYFLNEVNKYRVMKGKEEKGFY